MIDSCHGEQDLGCNLIEKAAVDRAARDMDVALDQALMQRRVPGNQLHEIFKEQQRFLRVLPDALSPKREPPKHPQSPSPAMAACPSRHGAAAVVQARLRTRAASCATARGGGGRSRSHRRLQRSQYAAALRGPPGHACSCTGWRTGSSAHSAAKWRSSATSPCAMQRAACTTCNVQNMQHATWTNGLLECVSIRSHQPLLPSRRAEKGRLQHPG